MMRRGVILFTMLMAAVLAGASGAGAESLVLSRAAVLRARPDARAAVVVFAPAGAEVEVLDRGRYWSRIVFDGATGFVARVNLIRLGAYLTPREVMALENPWCDLGYPYSGSTRYFTGLMALRHTGLLGALLGTHSYRPC